MSKDNLKKKSVIALAWDMAGTIGSQGASFIISIFLARLLEPAEFGLIGMAMVFIGVSQVFIDVGFASALIQNEENSNLTYSSIFYLNVTAGIVLTGIFFGLSPLIGDFYNSPEITHLIKWLSLIFIFNSFNLVQTAILKRNLNFRVLTIRQLIASILGGIAGVIFAFKGFGVYSLVIQQLTTAFLGTILLWSISGWKPDFRFSWGEVKKLFGFSSFVFFDLVISRIFNRLDVLLIGKVFSPATLGFYSRAVSLKSQVTNYSSASLSKVFFPVLSSLKNDPQEYKRIYFKVISVVAFLSYGLSGILYILGGDLMIGMFGQKWEPAIIIFQVLILSVCNFPLNSMMINAYMSMGRSEANFYVGLFRKLFKIIPLGIAYCYGIFEFTIAEVIVSYFLTITNIFFLKRVVDLPASEHFRKVFEGIIPLVFAVAAFNLIPTDGFLDRFGMALVFLLLYLIYHYQIRSEGLIFLRSNLKLNKMNLF